MHQNHLYISLYIALVDHYEFRSDFGSILLLNVMTFYERASSSLTLDAARSKCTLNDSTSQELRYSIEQHFLLDPFKLSEVTPIIRAALHCQTVLQHP